MSGAARCWCGCGRRATHALLTPWVGRDSSTGEDWIQVSRACLPDETWPARRLLPVVS